MLIVSANDACLAAVEHVGGDEAQFVTLMNAKAAALGLSDTHFSNGCGFDDSDHYSTAEDLATLSVMALDHPIFRQLVREERAIITPVNGHRAYVLHNTKDIAGTYSRRRRHKDRIHLQSRAVSYRQSFPERERSSPRDPQFQAPLEHREKSHCLRATGSRNSTLNFPPTRVSVACMDACLACGLEGETRLSGVPHVSGNAVQQQRLTTRGIRRAVDARRLGRRGGHREGACRGVGAPRGGRHRRRGRRSGGRRRRSRLCRGAPCGRVPRDRRDPALAASPAAAAARRRRRRGRS